MFSAAAQIRGICMYIVLFLAKDSGTLLDNCMRPELPTLFAYLKYSVYVLCVQPAVFPYQGHVKVPHVTFASHTEKRVGVREKATFP
jgi:hypothetical protein